MISPGDLITIEYGDYLENLSDILWIVISCDNDYMMAYGCKLYVLCSLQKGIMSAVLCDEDIIRFS